MSLKTGTELLTDRAVQSATVTKRGIKFSFLNMKDGSLLYKELEVTVEDYSAWLGGTSIQYAMPHLSADDRELFLTGMTF